MDIIKELKGKETIGISGHQRPDGDCVGSVMGMYLYLHKAFPEKQIDVFLEEPAEIFHCIKDIDVIHTDFQSKIKNYDAFIVLDAGKERIGDAEAYFDAAKTTFNIDHHISNSGSGKMNYIVPTASSASELVYDVICDSTESYQSLTGKKDNGVDMDIAKAIYIGIIHDTGVFQYSNTSPKTHRIAADLIAFGFDFPALIDKTFYEKTYLQNQIMGRALLESFLFLDGQCIVSMVDKRTMDFYEVNPKDLDGIVSQLRQTKGVECAIFMYQLKLQEYKVSLRSCGKVDVAKIAEVFGGGGHMRAAGVTMNGTFHDVINNLSLYIAKQLKE